MYDFPDEVLAPQRVLCGVSRHAKATQLAAVASFPPNMPVYIPAGHLRRLGVLLDDQMHDDAPYKIAVGDLRKALT